MTEQEWLASTDIKPMLAFAAGLFSNSLRPDCARKPQSWFIDRKVRLFDDACFATFGLTIDDVGLQTSRPPQAASLFREVFGNPFRPVVLGGWVKSPSVQTVASAIAADGAFGDLGVLADALEEAGCDSDDILFHLRGIVGCHICEGAGYVYMPPESLRRMKCGLCNGVGRLPPPPHVRGCWALDCILGYE